MARAGVAITESFGDLLTPGLRKIYSDTFDSKPEMRPMLYNVASSSTSYEKTSSLGAFGDIQPFKGVIQYDDFSQGYDVTFSHIQLANGFKVERQLFDDDLYGAIAKKPAGLAAGAWSGFEKYAASVFNAADSGSGTITVEGVTILSNTEGQALISTAHPYSPDDSGTQSNKGTTALSPVELEVIRRAMAVTKNDRRSLISVIPDLILVPRALEQTAFEIVASKGKVDTAENNANFMFGRYKLAVWDFLSDSNNYFVIDSSMMKNSLHWYDRIPLEFFKDSEFDTLMSKFANYARCSYGFDDWHWVYGAIVA